MGGIHVLQGLSEVIHPDRDEESPGFDVPRAPVVESDRFGP